MTDDEKLTALEGRILAHRRLLAQLLATLPQAVWERLADGLSDSSILQDGQEDPGAVPAQGLVLELSIAEEHRELAILTRRLRDTS